MEKEVEETVVKVKDRSSLNRTLFYVGYFNYPCEVAVVEYSLEKVLAGVPLPPGQNPHGLPVQVHQVLQGVSQPLP